MVDRVSPLPQHNENDVPNSQEHISHAAPNQVGRSGAADDQRQNTARLIDRADSSLDAATANRETMPQVKSENSPQRASKTSHPNQNKMTARGPKPSYDNSERASKSRRGQVDHSSSRKKSGKRAAGHDDKVDKGKINDRAGQKEQSENRRLKASKISNGRTQNDWSNSNKAQHKYAGLSYAALDLGTNNCRLLIARPDEDGFTIIDAFSRVVRLGEGLTKSGRINEDAMDRAVEALSVCAQKLKRRNVTLSRSVATEACRQADNGVQFIERVRKVTGIVLDIISPEEEARLAVLGCHVLLSKGNGPALIFDIGGGSTELVLVSTDTDIPEIIEWISIPWGVVTLTESEPVDGDNDAARMKAYNNMCERVRTSFAEFGKRLPMDGDFRTLGTSGTITTLASVYLGLPFYNRSKVDGITVPADAMREISQDLARKSPRQRALQPCIGEQRSDLVVAGCAILEGILDIWPTQTLGVADRGIREGILRALMKNEGSVSLRSKK